MDKYAPKFSKVLVIPDPHYIPGYAGYCPQLKYNVGKSYSRLTAELLTSPDVKHSNRLLLHTGRLPSPQSDGALTRRSLSDSNLKKMIPGYTGFIPKSQNYFACSYSEVCRKALSEFYQDGRHSNTRWRSTDLPAVAKNTSQQFEKPKLPLVAISDQVINYQPLKPFIPTGTPYSMDDNDPHKYFISGFTGHVPKSRFLIGKGYPITTNQALIQFAQQQRHDATSQDATGGKSSTKTPMPSVYPSTKRVLPSFTGHIPGYKFMYGHTFGQLSQKALEKSSNKRIAQTKSLSHQ